MFHSLMYVTYILWTVRGCFASQKDVFSVIKHFRHVIPQDYLFWRCNAVLQMRSFGLCSHAREL